MDTAYPPLDMSRPKCQKVRTTHDPTAPAWEQNGHYYDSAGRCLGPVEVVSPATQSAPTPAAVTPAAALDAASAAQPRAGLVPQPDPLDQSAKRENAAALTAERLAQ